MAMNAAVSRPKVAMWIALSMLAVKAVTNYIFIFGWALFRVSEAQDVRSLLPSMRS